MKMRTSIMTTALVALGLAGGLTSTPPVHAQNYPYQGQASFSLDGTVDRVDVDRDRVIVAGDDGRSYTVDTYRSSISLRNTSRRGETGDLVPGMRLHVTGTRLSGDIVEADQVSVQPFRSARPTIPVPGHRSNAPVRNSDPYGRRSDPYNTNPYSSDSYSNDSYSSSSRGITMRGTVESVDNRRGTFVLRINNRTRTVYVNSSTDLTDLDRSVNRGNRIPLRVGDRVSVAGVLQSNGTVTADTLSARNLTGSSSNYRNDSTYRRGNSLQGVVTQTSSKLLSRDLKVRLSSGREVTVHVPKDVTIRRNGRAISVHELTSDDQVRIDGSYDGNDFKATRIEVLGRAYSDNNDYNSGNDNGGYNDRGGYSNRGGNNNGGYNRNGRNSGGYNRDGYNSDGYDEDGYNRNGYDRDGNNRDSSRDSGF